MDIPELPGIEFFAHRDIDIPELWNVSEASSGASCYCRSETKWFAVDTLRRKVAKVGADAIRQKIASCATNLNGGMEMDAQRLEGLRAALESQAQRTAEQLGIEVAYVHPVTETPNTKPRSFVQFYYGTIGQVSRRMEVVFDESAGRWVPDLE